MLVIWSQHWQTLDAWHQTQPEEAAVSAGPGGEWRSPLLGVGEVEDLPSVSDERPSASTKRITANV
eukprot:414328-Alexandrium_andersonii.AAC.1